ncbi:16S rRNA (guanine(527)-N(7))-methyltransferase RsmG [Rhodoferax sp.]|uniref:16S rRNA (guanine(527)-N(7))-methyltransferase RsmG n=1 Tax=Rhodoferax sp. TaxID=50421 RepID=UPI002628D9C5|nr:16S rRNA (guanine(527)-N(7))-methyltransferase RsmG [Rhodoferax sp.]MDD2918839.1 16S rRNA (guanine(527)-N(7))-methyltransferase RsmG [Rhodoferax sp.]
MQAIEANLRAGLTALELDLSDAQVASLLAYQGLIQKWNKVYNLTAVRDPGDMLTHHLLDSLAVIGPLCRQLAQMTKTAAKDVANPDALRLLDVGSGAGLPGVVVAICCPDIQVDCVDAVAKKAAFIQQAAVTLKLPNLRGVHARVENLSEKYKVICSRAFASLADFTNWSRQALAEEGVWLAMKGKYPVDELALLSPDIDVFHVEQVAVPGLNAERCLIWMKPK